MCDEREVSQVHGYRFRYGCTNAHWTHYRFCFAIIELYATGGMVARMWMSKWSTLYYAWDSIKPQRYYFILLSPKSCSRQFFFVRTQITYNLPSQFPLWYIKFFKMVPVFQLCVWTLRSNVNVHAGHMNQQNVGVCVSIYVFVRLRNLSKNAKFTYGLLRSTSS